MFCDMKNATSEGTLIRGNVKLGDNKFYDGNLRAYDIVYAGS